MPSTRPSPSEPLSLLGDYSVAEFLRQFWQQQPLLIRNALPEFVSPISPDELAGLACDDDTESLLILEKHGPTPWYVEHGPFTEHRFADLPETHISLLVHAVDQKVAAVHALKARFNFIPHWRMDDVMISYAAPHGSVGPHRDQYDVFLLQALGRRRWQINRDERLPVSTNLSTELNLLEPFDAEDDWILEPGDMLYLPPGVAHYGVALDPCMTYSIGFRAPSHAEILSAWADDVAETDAGSKRYRDVESDPCVHPGEINSATVNELVSMVRNHIDCEQTLISSFGKLVTQATRGITEPPTGPDLTQAGLIERLHQGDILIHHPGTRFAFWCDDNGSGLIFCDGEEKRFAAQDKAAVQLLCDRPDFTYQDLSAHLHNSSFVMLLVEYVNTGKLSFRNDVWV